ncbi:MAG: amidohydrolase [Saprospiraceae bacterium]|nr:amidohydrolase [Saprospiraceae bacterium]
MNFFHIIYNNLFVLILILLIQNGCRSVMKADLVITNAEIYTADKTIKNVEAVGCKDGKIIFIGSNNEAKEFITKQTNVIDAKGAFVTPGLIEGHGHFSGLGKSLIELNLINTKSWEEIENLIFEKVKNVKPGEWIVGRGWHQEKWDSVPINHIHNYPFHKNLSAKTTDNPVLLIHASGHALFANQKAMDLAGISKETEDPFGGEIVRNNAGEAIGIFEERAMSLIKYAHDDYKKRLKKSTQDSIWLHSITLAQQECLKNGITSFQDAGSTFNELSQYEKLALSEKLDIRLWVMARESYENMKNEVGKYKKIGIGNNFYTCNAIKSEVDGALGAFGAWLLKPYDDKPGFSGQNTTDIYDVKKIADLAVQNDMQFCVHAIGDRANRVVLDIYEGVMAQNSKIKDWRWRIEHAQHIDTMDIPRFAKNKIIASMQGIHCTSDAPFVVKRLGRERARLGAYAWRSLLDAGVVIANGTDVPVEDLNPFKSLYASVTRKNVTQDLTFFPEQKMTREEALYSYTLGNAYAAFEDEIKGSLTVGKFADIVILDKNILSCPENEILQTKVLYTIVNGEVKYRQP